MNKVVPYLFVGLLFFAGVYWLLDDSSTGKGKHRSGRSKYSSKNREGRDGDSFSDRLKKGMSSRLSGKLTVATFHVRSLTPTRRNQEELNSLVEGMKNYDVIALQGVNNEQALQSFVERLNAEGETYSYLISPWVGAVEKDHLAFLYRSKRIRVIHDGVLLSGPVDGAIFDKQPYGATFRAGSFLFTLINADIHVRGDVALVRQQTSALADVYQSVQMQSSQENNVMVLGHWDIDTEDESFSRLVALDKMRAVVDEPTAIKGKENNDNIFIPTKYVDEFDGDAGVLFWDQDNRSERTSSVRRISGYRPVWASFSISGEVEDEDDAEEPVRGGGKVGFDK